MTGLRLDSHKKLEKCPLGKTVTCRKKGKGTKREGLFTLFFGRRRKGNHIP